MSCHDTGSGVSILHDIPENFTFCGHIQRGSCFIQQKDWRFSEECPGNGKSLGLAL